MHKNCCHQSCSFSSRYASNRLSAGALPQTPLGELIALPRPLTGLGGGTPRGKGKRKGREREGRGRWDWDPSIPAVASSKFYLVAEATVVRNLCKVFPQLQSSWESNLHQRKCKIDVLP